MSANPVKTAILVPAYNSQGTIAETLESFLRQDNGLAGIEGVYLADDCSKDQTIEAAQNCWRGKIPLEIIHAKQNRGERGNVNNAVNLLANKGIEWILLFHADDLAKPHWAACMLERIAIADSRTASVASSWDNFFTGENPFPGEEKPLEPPQLYAGEDGIRYTLLKGSWWHISGGAMRIKTLQEIGGFHPEMPQAGDWEWSLRCMKQGWGIEYIPRSLVLYRLHHTSVSSHSMNIDRDIRERLLVINEYADYLTEGEAGALYREQAGNALRRMARAVTRLRFRRVGYAWQTLLMVLRNWRTCQPRLSTAP